MGAAHSQAALRHTPLPTKPSSVCQNCWEGPFSMQFGLPSHEVSQFNKKRDTSYSYSTSFEELRTRALAGCLWCQLLVAVWTTRPTSTSGASSAGSLNVTVQGSIETQASWNPDHIQCVNVTINDFSVFKGLVHAALDDPATPYINMRSSILDVGSPRALALAKECLDQCVHRHESCAAISAIADPLLPTRLIDCTDPTHPRLVSTHHQSGKYLTLSYVWGGDQVHKTTTSNISLYESGIDLALLPATIRDAIHVIHALGYRLLWVDSLCIIQDSDEDKRREIGRMHHIYRYAHLTIIAASAQNVDEGFLQDRPPPPQLDFGALRSGGDITLPFICPTSATTPQVGTIHLTSIRIGRVYTLGSRWPYYSSNPGPISTRAWCMQEYLMSPRSLIFTPNTLQFRCQTTTQSVGGSLCDTLNEKRLPDVLFLPDPPLAAHGSKEHHAAHDAWLYVVQDYTRRAASVPSDQLVACAAIAEQFHRALRTDYLAGLWRDTLLQDLLWCKQERGVYAQRPAAYRAPSWSWAAVEGEVAWWGRRAQTFVDENALAEVLRCEVVLEDIALPFGQVTGATLVLRAALLPCTIRGGRDPRDNEVLVHVVRQSGPGAGVLSLDDEVEPEPEICNPRGDAEVDCEGDLGIERLWAVPLLRGNTSVEGLLVTQTASKGSEERSTKVRHRRVGSFYLGFMEEPEKDGYSGKAARELARALMNREYMMEDIELV